MRLFIFAKYISIFWKQKVWKCLTAHNHSLNSIVYIKGDLVKKIWILKVWLFSLVDSFCNFKKKLWYFFLFVTVSVKWFSSRIVHQSTFLQIFLLNLFAVKCDPMYSTSLLFLEGLIAQESKCNGFSWKGMIEGIKIVRLEVHLLS